jgi:hypothetical protein
VERYSLALISILQILVPFFLKTCKSCIFL